MVEIINRFGEAIIALAGVVIGGLMTPYLSARLERNKFKKSIKSDLVNYLNLTHEYSKQRAECLVHNIKYRSDSNELWAKLSGTLSEQERSAQQWQLNVVDSRISQSNEDIRLYTERVIDTESKILASISNIKDYCRRKTYVVINDAFLNYLVKKDSEVSSLVDECGNIKRDDIPERVEKYFITINGVFRELREIINDTL